MATCMPAAISERDPSTRTPRGHAFYAIPQEGGVEFDERNHAVSPPRTAPRSGRTYGRAPLHSFRRLCRARTSWCRISRARRWSSVALARGRRGVAAGTKTRLTSGDFNQSLTGAQATSRAPEIDGRRQPCVRLSAPASARATARDPPDCARPRNPPARGGGRRACRRRAR